MNEFVEEYLRHIYRQRGAQRAGHRHHRRLAAEPPTR
jgi:hypothetical protein